MFRPHVWSDVGLVVCDSSWYPNSVDDKIWSTDMFKNEYWFRVASVHDIHESSGFRNRSRYQDPNHMTSVVKSRQNVLVFRDITVFDSTVNRCLPCIRTTVHSRFIVNIEQQSFRSERIYWCNWQIFVKLRRPCSRVSLLSWFIRLV